MLGPYFNGFAVSGKDMLFTKSRINNDRVVVYCFSTNDLKLCKMEFEIQKSRFCSNMSMENYRDRYCCSFNNDTFYRRDKNSNFLCKDVIRAYEMNTKEIRKWKAVQNHVEVVNSAGIIKTSFIRRKLLAQQYIHEYNNTTELLQYDAQQKTGYGWEYDMKSILLKFLVLLVMMFTFFAIHTSVAWLLSLYILKRLTRQNAHRSNMFLDVTEL